MEDSVKIAKVFGRHLIGRDIGAEIRHKYFAGGPDTWPVSLDFEGVEQATESCIDELFGTLARSHGINALQRIVILSAKPGVQEAADYVLAILRDPPPPLNATIIRGLLEPSGRRRQTKGTAKIRFGRSVARKARKK